MALRRPVYMGNLSQSIFDQTMHPLDLVEETVAMRDWSLERTARDESAPRLFGGSKLAWTDLLGQ